MWNKYTIASLYLLSQFCGSFDLSVRNSLIYIIVGGTFDRIVRPDNINP